MWRAHRRIYEATDHGGSLRFSARYHRGLDQFPRGKVWPAIYLALAPEGSLGEILRHVSAANLADLNAYRLTELEVDLSAVLDCRDAAPLGLRPKDLVDDYDFTVTQQLAAAAIAERAEGVLVPSATGLGDNLVIFPGQLRGTSSLTIVGSRDLRLFVPR